MRLVTEELVKKYELTDSVLDHLNANETASDRGLTSQVWLRESLAKRCIFDQLYGDLLNSKGRKILDVGGGVSSFTRVLAARHDYELIDLLAHEGGNSMRPILESFGTLRVHAKDWFEFDITSEYDVIIANDLFPNVDQRLELFLEKMLSACDQLRLSLTFYQQPRFYLAQRLGRDEILCVLAWNGKQVRNALHPYIELIDAPAMKIFETDQKSLWANGRQVALVQLTGTRNSRMPTGS